MKPWLAFLSLLFSFQAYAIPGFVQGNSNSAAAVTSVSVTFGASPTDGNLLVAYVGTSGTTANRVSSLTETGATWSKIAGTATSGSGGSSEFWYAPSVSGAATTVTANLAATLGVYIAVAEVTGMILNSGVVDVSAVNTGSGTESFAVSSGTTAVTHGDVIVFGGFTSTIGTGAFTGLTAGYTKIGDQSTGVIGSAAYSIKSGKQTTQNLSGTLSGPGNAGNYSASIVSFLPVEGLIRESCSSTFSSTSGNCTLTLGATSGNLVLVSVVVDGCTTPTISDSGTNTWTSRKTQVNGAVQSKTWSSILTNNIAANGTITIGGCAGSGNSEAIVSANEFSGINSVSPFDAEGKASGSGTVSVSTATGTTQTPSFANEVVLGVIGTTDGTNASGSFSAPATGYSVIENSLAATGFTGSPNGGVRMLIAYKTVSTIATQQMTSTYSVGSGTTAYAGVITTYVSASQPAASSVHFMSLLGVGK